MGEKRLSPSDQIQKRITAGKNTCHINFYTDLSEANVVFLSANVWRRDYQFEGNKKQIYKSSGELIGNFMSRV